MECGVSFLGYFPSPDGAVIERILERFGEGAVGRRNAGGGAEDAGFLGLHGIESAVGGIEKATNGLRVAGKAGNANTDGKLWLFRFVFEEFANAPSDQCGGSHASFREDHGEFIAAMTSGSVRVATGVLEDLSDPAKGAVTGEMTEFIVDLF